jgi:hypothetical protein
MNKHNEPEWADEKYITRMFGITHMPLYTLRKAGKVRSVSLRLEGRNYGKRLYHIGSIREFLAVQEARETMCEAKQNSSRQLHQK